MENASKALIMAAETLIGVLMLSLIAYLIVNLGSSSADVSKEIENQRVVEANSKYTSYVDKELTIYDITTIQGYAKENNKYYDVDEGQDSINKVVVKINGTDITNWNSDDLILSNYAYSRNDNVLAKYKLINNNIHYNYLGKVDEVNFINF